MGDYALPALFAALAFFWVSTRQVATWLRLLIWIGGAALLFVAALAEPSTQNQFGLRQALQNAWAFRASPQESGLAQAFYNNAQTVARFVPQLLDFFLIAGVTLGVLSLLAFTAGDRLERFLRPTIIGLAAFVAGSVAALTVVAIGLGGQVRPTTYIGEVTQIAFNDEPAVHDGDTFWLGEVSLRLWGVDAPELNQECLGASGCGEIARVHLQEILVGNLVQCDQRHSLNTGRREESFGRPLVECWVLEGSERRSVGERMITDGYAARYKNDPRYFPEAQEQFKLGCTLRPHIWRSRQPADAAARQAFERNGTILDPALAIGTCI